MIKCPVCQELISINAPTYKCSRGFVDKNGYFLEDISVVFHQECSDLLEPYGLLEEYIRDN